MQKCDRCKKETLSLRCSRFNTQMCCIDCLKEEEAHPEYPRAKAVELEEVKQGNMKFEGVGLPADLQAKYESEMKVIEELESEVNGFVLTDDASSQYQLSMGNKTFHMVDMMLLPDDSYRVYSGTVDLSDYSEEAIQEIVSLYYDSYDHLKSLCKNDDEADGILAECIFETEMRDFTIVFRSKKEADAILFAKNYMLDYQHH